jgi:hypothetical protein
VISGYSISVFLFYASNPTPLFSERGFLRSAERACLLVEQGIETTFQDRLNPYG